MKHQYPPEIIFFLVQRKALKQSFLIGANLPSTPRVYWAVPEIYFRLTQLGEGNYCGIWWLKATDAGQQNSISLRISGPKYQYAKDEEPTLK